MPILNYTTKIEAMQTVGEIQGILAKAGASSISIDFESGDPAALTFAISFGTDLLNYRLPSNPDGVYQALCREPKLIKSQKTKAQAKKVAWRIVKDWVEAQLALVEAEIALLPQVFLPYVIAPNGQTLFQVIEEQGLKALAPKKS